MRLPIPSLHDHRTARLRFRRLVLNDEAWWMHYINDAEAIRFMPFTVGSRDDCRLMLQRSMDRYVADGSGLHALELLSTGEPVGQCGLLTQTVDGLPELEIGYHLLPAHWGQGYATEAARACMAIAERHRPCDSVISLIDEANTKSRAVAARNGMVYEKRTVHRGVPALVYRAELGHEG